MGGGILVICLTLLHAASSNPTINPSSTTLSSSVNPSSSTSSVSQTHAAISVNSIPSVSTISQSSTTSNFANPSVTTSSEFGFLSPKPSSSYEVTENVIDVPDNRTLSPILPNYGLTKPLNIANTSISINNVIKNGTGDDNNQIKRNSFTYVHITKDTEEKKENGIVKIFRGIKDYVYNLKRGVVDGLHNYFHRNDNKEDKQSSSYDKFHRSNGDFLDNDDDEVEEVNFHRKFHTNFDSDENFDDFEYDHDGFKY